jgi:hypothetical protein
MKLSELQKGQFFSFRGKRIIYEVSDIKYNLDWYNNYCIYYKKQGSFTFYCWVSNQADKIVFIV